MDHILACKCGDIIVKSDGSSSKVRGKLLIFKGDQGYAVCKGCGAEVPIPVTIDTELLKSLRSSPTLPLFVKKEG